VRRGDDEDRASRCPQDRAADAAEDHAPQRAVGPRADDEQVEIVALGGELLRRRAFARPALYLRVAVRDRVALERGVGLLRDGVQRARRRGLGDGAERGLRDVGQLRSGLGNTCSAAARQPSSSPPYAATSAVRGTYGSTYTTSGRAPVAWASCHPSASASRADGEPSKPMIRSLSM
jgi:hypothetical protein